MPVSGLTRYSAATLRTEGRGSPSLSTPSRIIATTRSRSWRYIGWLSFHSRSIRFSSRAVARDMPLSLCACNCACALQVEVSVHGLVPRHHISPVLGVVVGVDDGEHGVVHVSALRAAGNIGKIKFHRLAVRRR